MNRHPRSDMTSLSKGRLTTLELVMLSLIGALMYVLQTVLAFLPNIEPVSLIIVASTRVFGKKTLYPIYVFVLASGLTNGFNTYWASYLYVWAILCFAALLIGKTGTQRTLPYVLASAAFGLLFGGLCAIVQLLIGGPAFAFSWWLSGISFDLIHCAGNAVSAALLLAPLTNLLRYLLRHISKL